MCKNFSQAAWKKNSSGESNGGGQKFYQNNQKSQNYYQKSQNFYPQSQGNMNNLQTLQSGNFYSNPDNVTQFYQNQFQQFYNNNVNTNMYPGYFNQYQGTLNYQNPYQVKLNPNQITNNTSQNMISGINTSVPQSNLPQYMYQNMQGYQQFSDDQGQSQVSVRNLSESVNLKGNEGDQNL